MATESMFITSNSTSSEEVYDFTCTPCEKRNKTSEAVKFCLDCQEYICSGCIELHNIFSSMAGHVLEKAEVTSRDKTCSISYIPTERCPKHPAEIIKMYCTIHDEVACTVCMTIDHKSCNDIHYIPNVAGALYTKQMNTDTIAALSIASEKIKTFKDMYNKVLGDLNTAKETTLQAIQKFRQELNHILDKLEQNTKQQLDDQYQILQAQWQVLIEKGIAVTHNLQKQLDQLLNTASNISQLFVLTKMTKENISLADTMSRQLLPTSIQITFSQNQAIFSCLEKLSSLGNVSHTIDKVDQIPKHCVKIESDTESCCILGSCVLDSGHVLLTDYKNNKVKLFDTIKNAVTSYCTMPNLPIAVCAVYDAEAAVSLNNRMVQFVSISNGLLPTRILKMSHDCFGLAVAVDKMYITDDDNLYVHELNGNLLRLINIDQSGHKIFSLVRHLAVNNGKIHVADANNGLITLNTQGQVLWKYTGSDLKGAYGVCTDDCGHVFVCGFYSHNVLKIRFDEQTLGELVNKENYVFNARSVLFHKKSCRLIISYAGNDNILTFYVDK